MNDARTRKNLRDHDKAVTTALETVSNLITDAYRNGTEDPDSPWGSNPDASVLQVAQIGAAQAIALSIRSLTAHLIVGTGQIADELHEQPYARQLTDDQQRTVAWKAMHQADDTSSPTTFIRLLHDAGYQITHITDSARRSTEGTD